MGAPRLRRSLRGRRWAALALLGVAATVLTFWRPASVAVQTLLFLPALFPAFPLDLLGRTSQPPTRSEHSLTYAAGTVEIDLYHPSNAGPHGGVIFLLGAMPLPRRDPLVERFAQALARTGLVVLVPESSSLSAGRVVPEELDALRQSYELLASQPDVDLRRTGFLGLSVGGGLSMAAVAAEPALRDRVRFVNALGGYYDVETLLVDAASRSLDVGGQVMPWAPDERTLQVLAAALVDTLPNAAERDLLERAYVRREESEPASWGALSPRAQDVRMLLEGTTRAEARAAIERLPADVREQLNLVSPARYVKDLGARLFLMHDTGDTLIPFTQSRALAAAAPPGVVQRFTEFSIFAHVIPDRPVPWQTLVPDVWALYWHVHAVLLEAL